MLRTVFLNVMMQYYNKKLFSQFVKWVQKIKNRPSQRREIA
jgi:hypothetical protein